MTTAELIDTLKYVDPEGTKEVGLETDGSGRLVDFVIRVPSNADRITLGD